MSKNNDEVRRRDWGGKKLGTAEGSRQRGKAKGELKDKEKEQRERLKESRILPPGECNQECEQTEKEDEEQAGVALCASSLGKEGEERNGKCKTGLLRPGAAAIYCTRHGREP